MKKWIVETNTGTFRDVRAVSEIGAVHAVMNMTFCRVVIYSVRQQFD